MARATLFGTTDTGDAWSATADAQGIAWTRPFREPAKELRLRLAEDAAREPLELLEPEARLRLGAGEQVVVVSPAARTDWRLEVTDAAGRPVEQFRYVLARFPQLRLKLSEEATHEGGIVAERVLAGEALQFVDPASPQLARARGIPVQLPPHGSLVTAVTLVRAAVDAAAHGDLIAVRAGRYESLTTSKGVSILAEPGTVLAPSFLSPAPAVRIDGLPAGRRFTLQNADLSGATNGGVVGTNCAGEIVLENVSGHLPGPWGWQAGNPLVTADAVERLVLSRCRLTGAPALFVRDSTMLASDSSCIGVDGFVGHGEFAAGVGVQAVDSLVVLSRCVLKGGDLGFGSGFSVTAQPALHSMRATWTITGLPGSTITAGNEPGRAVSAITGTGSVELDPAVQLVPQNGAPPVAPGITLRSAAVPPLSAQGAAPGGTVQVDLFSAPGDAVLLAVGFLGARSSLPGLGDLWLDPARGILVAASGVQGPSANFPVTVPVPVSVALLSLAFTWQGLSAPPHGPARLSNPATYVHGW